MSKQRRVKIGPVSKGMDHTVMPEAAPQRSTQLVDRRHITVRTDDSGRKIGLDRDGVDWLRLTLRARAILEGHRRS